MSRDIKYIGMDVHKEATVDRRAERQWQAGERLRNCGLELHPEKTKIVYCKDEMRKGRHTNEKFDFLGYEFRPAPDPIQIFSGRFAGEAATLVWSRHWSTDSIRLTGFCREPSPIRPDACPT